MKNVLLILLLILPACTESDAWMSPVMIGGGVPAAAASCTEEYDYGSGGGSAINLSRYAGSQCHAYAFIAGDWGAITKAQMYLAQVGSVDGMTYNIRIYSSTLDSSHQIPDAVLSDATCTFSGTTFGDGAKYFGCVFTAPQTLGNGTQYWLEIDRGLTLNSGNYLNTYYADDAGDEDFIRSTDDTSWAEGNIQAYGADGRLKLFSGAGCEAD